MTESTISHRPVDDAPQPQGLSGDVVYMFAYDVAYEMRRTPIAELLGRPVAQFVVDTSKRSPKQLFFYRPQMVRMPLIEKIGPRGAIRMERTIKLLPVGAISITIKVPFQVEHIEDLVDYHDLRFSDGTDLEDEARNLAEQARRELARYYIRPVNQLTNEEAYTVFCIKGPLRAADDKALSAEDWLLANRRRVAALLTQEVDPEQLSDQEAEESSGRYYSYYENDITVLDWDAALLIDQANGFDEVLYIMELANLQLAELEAYDRILDNAVDRSYRDLAGSRTLRSLGIGGVQDDLREIRIDLSRLSDELSNITKFFGDWHLARIYKGLSDRFHLGDWHRAIDEKLKTLDDLYRLLQSDRTNRTMLVLEVLIVLLFIVEIVKSFLVK